LAVGFQLVRINPSGGAIKQEKSGKFTVGFQLVRINPSGGVVDNDPRTRVNCFQLVRINPSGGAWNKKGLPLFITRGFQLVRINPSGGGISGVSNFFQNKVSN